MSDRTLGYGVIFFLVIFLIIPTAYLSNKAFKPVYHRTIVFDSVNTLSFLQIEDPVRVRGIENGIVTSISWKNNQTYVTIETSEKITLHRDYRIHAEDKGMMGDRYVSINPGSSTEPLVDEKALLKGIFLMGPTEAVARMHVLKDIVDSTSVLLKRLQYGTGNGKPLAEKFHEILHGFDSLSVSLTTVLASVDRAVAIHADTVSVLLAKAEAVSRQLGDAIPERLVQFDAFLQKTDVICVKTDSLIASSVVLLERVNDAQSVTLLNDLTVLKSGLQKLRNAVTSLKEQGLPLPIRLR